MSKPGTLGGLFGETSGTNNTITASYWDANAAGIADDSDANMPEGKTASELQPIT